MEFDTDSLSSATLARIAEDGRLGRDDAAALAGLSWRRSGAGPGQSLAVRDGLAVVRSGWACRLRILPSGQRQLVALLLPGDVCSFDFLAGMRRGGGNGGSVLALSALSILQVPVDEFALAVESRPNVMRALLTSLQIERAIGEEHLVSLGNRSARGRMAHLLCELSHRLAKVGLVQAGRFALPMTQPEMGEYLALSSVHVNRTLQYLRSNGLVSVSGGHVRILDGDGLARLGEFNPDYLRIRAGEEDAEQALDMRVGNGLHVPPRQEGAGLRESP